ncbi:hypothetical protein B0H16DRAFT_1452362 [Mycena metata]|uniref:Uncharacterized protein n=1 Tax=Mycena metata TaxID=1033252 RepID=A0AAD7JQU8_9AGAR|nr:hypothetical protein B0H16DRAFT_1452362 [Mycena metata]
MSGAAGDVEEGERRTSNERKKERAHRRPPPPLPDWPSPSRPRPPHTADATAHGVLTRGASAYCGGRTGDEAADTPSRLHQACSRRGTRTDSGLTPFPLTPTSRSCYHSTPAARAAVKLELALPPCRVAYTGNGTVVVSGGFTALGGRTCFLHMRPFKLGAVVDPSGHGHVHRAALCVEDRRGRRRRRCIGGWAGAGGTSPAGMARFIFRQKADYRRQRGGRCDEEHEEEARTILLILIHSSRSSSSSSALERAQKDGEDFAHGGDALVCHGVVAVDEEDGFLAREPLSSISQAILPSLLLLRSRRAPRSQAPPHLRSPPRLAHPRHGSVAQRETFVQTGLCTREPVVRLVAGIIYLQQSAVLSRVPWAPSRQRQPQRPTARIPGEVQVGLGMKSASMAKREVELGQLLRKVVDEVLRKVVDEGYAEVFLLPLDLSAWSRSTLQARVIAKSKINSILLRAAEVRRKAAVGILWSGWTLGGAAKVVRRPQDLRDITQGVGETAEALRTPPSNF